MEELRFDIEYRNRKTLGIKIEDSGSIRVLAPIGTSQRVIKEILGSKEQWILNKIKKIENQESPSPVAFGASIPFLGTERLIRPLNHTGRSVDKVVSSAGDLLIGSKDWSREMLIDSMMDFFRDNTREKAFERVELYWRSIGRKPEAIVVRDQKTRWASCSTIGNLSFNLRCSMLPIELFDYIVIHELCHLVYMDHSREFWKLLEVVLPDYIDKRQRLKTEGAVIFRYFRER